MAHLLDILTSEVPDNFSDLCNEDQSTLIRQLYKRWVDDDDNLDKMREAMGYFFFFAVFCSKSMVFHELGFCIEAEFRAITDLDLYDYTAIADVVFARVKEEDIPYNVAHVVMRACLAHLPHASDTATAAKLIVNKFSQYM